MSATKPEPGELWSWSHDRTTLTFLILESNAHKPNAVNTSKTYFCLVLTDLGMVRAYGVYVGEGGCHRLVSEAVREQNE
jgi:hypothetical protein